MDSLVGVVEQALRKVRRAKRAKCMKPIIRALTGQRCCCGLDPRLRHRKSAGRKQIFLCPPLLSFVWIDLSLSDARLVSLPLRRSGSRRLAVVTSPPSSLSAAPVSRRSPSAAPSRCGAAATSARCRWGGNGDEAPRHPYFSLCGVSRDSIAPHAPAHQEDDEDMQ